MDKFRVTETIVWFIDAESNKDAVRKCQNSEGSYQTASWRSRRRKSVVKS
jgi:hypothetical protein